MEPLVSIITINYNQAQLTCDLLASLRRVTYPSIEVIVIDNNSIEDPGPIARDFPEAKLIVSPVNLGFAGGNNLGIQASTGDYLLFLNNDTEVDAGFIEPLVSLFKSNPDAGAASPKILYHEPGNILQYAGSSRIDPFTGRSRRIGWMEEDKGQHDQLRTTDLAHGAAMIVPRAVIDRVGRMPEFFFLYYEEVDWCESIKRAGYKIFFVPESRVYHKESMSIGKTSTLKTYYMTRNRVLYMRRNTVGIRKLIWMMFFLFFSLPKNALKYTIGHDIAHAKAFWKALAWNATHLSNGNKVKLFTE